MYTEENVNIIRSCACYSDVRKDYSGLTFASGEFQGLSRFYAVIYKKNAVIIYLQIDPHPLVNLRINIMAQHCDEFLDTYDVEVSCTGGPCVGVVE